MENLKIKHKEYKFVKEINDHCFIFKRNNQLFFFRKYEPYLEEDNLMAYQVKKLNNTGIKTPKFIAADKKQGYIVTEYIEGEKLIDIISREDISEEILEQLFQQAYMAKMNKISVDFEPDVWILKDKTIYYVCPHYLKYDKDRDLPTLYLPLYFNTPELDKYMKDKGVFYDKKRIKNAFETNKEMVLATCKYYK